MRSSRWKTRWSSHTGRLKGWIQLESLTISALPPYLNHTMMTIPIWRIPGWWTTNQLSIHNCVWLFQYNSLPCLVYSPWSFIRCSPPLCLGSLCMDNAYITPIWAYQRFGHIGIIPPGCCFGLCWWSKSAVPRHVETATLPRSILTFHFHNDAAEAVHPLYHRTICHLGRHFVAFQMLVRNPKDRVCSRG